MVSSRQCDKLSSTDRPARRSTTLSRLVPSGRESHQRSRSATDHRALETAEGKPPKNLIRWIDTQSTFRPARTAPIQFRSARVDNRPRCSFPHWRQHPNVFSRFGIDSEIGDKSAITRDVVRHGPSGEPSSRVSVPLPLEGFSKITFRPVRCEPNRMREPSCDQTGNASRAASDEIRTRRGPSKTQIS